MVGAVARKGNSCLFLPSVVVSRMDGRNLLLGAISRDMPFLVTREAFNIASSIVSETIVASWSFESLIGFALFVAEPSASAVFVLLMFGVPSFSLMSRMVPATLSLFPKGQLVQLEVTGR